MLHLLLDSAVTVLCTSYCFMHKKIEINSIGFMIWKKEKF